MHILWASEAYARYRDISVLTVFCLIGIYGQSPLSPCFYPFPISHIPSLPPSDLFVGIFQVIFGGNQSGNTLKSRWWDRIAGTVDRNPWQRRTTSFFHLADVPVAAVVLVVVVAWPVSNAILCVDFNINLTVHFQLVLVLELGLCLLPSSLPACSALWLFSTDTCDSPVPLLTLHACLEFSEVFFLSSFCFTGNTLLLVIEKRGLLV